MLSIKALLLQDFLGKDFTKVQEFVWTLYFSTESSKQLLAIPPSA